MPANGRCDLTRRLKGYKIFKASSNVTGQLIETVKPVTRIREASDTLVTKVVNK
jgi:hypothetical protein